MRRRVGKARRCKSGKVSYRDEKSALYVARQTDWDRFSKSAISPIRAYFCSLCGHWHLTSEEYRT